MDVQTDFDAPFQYVQFHDGFRFRELEKKVFHLSVISILRPKLTIAFATFLCSLRSGFRCFPYLRPALIFEDLGGV